MLVRHQGPMLRSLFWEIFLQIFAEKLAFFLKPML
jgi:hypothetical protein